MSRKKRQRRERRAKAKLPAVPVTEDMADGLGLTPDQLLDAITKSEAAGFIEVERGPLGLMVRMTTHGQEMARGPVRALPRHLVQTATQLHGDELVAFLDEHSLPVPPEIEDPSIN